MSNHDQLPVNFQHRSVIARALILKEELDDVCPPLRRDDDSTMSFWTRGLDMLSASRLTSARLFCILRQAHCSSFLVPTFTAAPSVLHLILVFDSGSSIPPTLDVHRVVRLIEQRFNPQKNTLHHPHSELSQPGGPTTFFSQLRQKHQPSHRHEQRDTASA